MLEHKITLKVFATVWAEIDQAPETQAIRGKGLTPGEWRKDEDTGRVLVKEKDGGFIIDDADADLPVLGVTVPEAILVAQRLHGKLPLHSEWLKATGLLDGAPNGPAGAVLEPLPKVGDLKRWKKDQFTTRRLALGQERALPVTDALASGDVSRWKIRQLVTNGQEWLGQADAQTPGRLTLLPLPTSEQQAIVVGHGPREDAIDKAATLRFEAPGTNPWTQVKGVYAGFRIVLTVR
jgi:hypothetical protein